MSFSPSLDGFETLEIFGSTEPRSDMNVKKKKESEQDCVPQ
jgi:hypothetical protein